MKTHKCKYAYFVNAKGQTVISARSTYAGKTVKGYAKCDPRDTYDVQIGEELAAARCNARVAQKRIKNAEYKVAVAQAKVIAAQTELEKMLNYLADANNESAAAEAQVAKVLAKIG